MTMISTPEGIMYAQLCARSAALKLETKGLRHSSGRSMYALCKRAYNLRGTRESVLAQLEELKLKMLPARTTAVQ